MSTDSGQITIITTNSTMTTMHVVKKNNKKENYDDNKMLSIYEAITFHYKEFMEIAKREYYKLYHQKDWSDIEDSFKDVAHNTLLKMCDIFDKIKTTITHLKAYFCKAVRINYIHELLTPSRKYNLDDDFNEGYCLCVAEPNYDASMDLKKIVDDITEKFGERDSEIFQRFYEGDTLKELDNDYRIKNSAYVVRKIKKYIKNHYYGYNLQRRKE